MYRPRKISPLYLPLSRLWEHYRPNGHRHKWCRVAGDNYSNEVIVCIQCGEPK